MKPIASLRSSHKST